MRRRYRRRRSTRRTSAGRGERSEPRRLAPAPTFALWLRIVPSPRRVSFPSSLALFGYVFVENSSMNTYRFWHSNERAAMQSAFSKASVETRRGGGAGSRGIGRLRSEQIRFEPEMYSASNSTPSTPNFTSFVVLYSKSYPLDPGTTDPRSKRRRVGGAPVLFRRGTGASPVRSRGGRPSLVIASFVPSITPRVPIPRSRFFSSAPHVSTHSRAPSSLDEVIHKLARARRFPPS